MYKLPSGPAAMSTMSMNSAFDGRVHILRDEGLLEFTRGRGITVSGTMERGAVLERVRELLEFARRHGYRADDVVGLIQTVEGTPS